MREEREGQMESTTTTQQHEFQQQSRMAQMSGIEIQKKIQQHRQHRRLKQKEKRRLKKKIPKKTISKSRRLRYKARVRKWWAQARINFARKQASKLRWRSFKLTFREVNGVNPKSIKLTTEQIEEEKLRKQKVDEENLQKTLDYLNSRPVQKPEPKPSFVNIPNPY